LSTEGVTVRGYWIDHQGRYAIMLIFTRRPGEAIVIDGEIHLTGAKASLGITAPKSVRVDRLEVHEHRLCRANLETEKDSQRAVFLPKKLAE